MMNTSQLEHVQIFIFYAQNVTDLSEDLFSCIHVGFPIWKVQQTMGKIAILMTRHKFKENIRP